jgi:hypothetical protein
MTCFFLGIGGAIAVFGLKWLIEWMTYVNNRD